MRGLPHCPCGEESHPGQRPLSGVVSCSHPAGTPHCCGCLLSLLPSSVNTSEWDYATMTLSVSGTMGPNASHQLCCLAYQLKSCDPFLPDVAVFPLEYRHWPEVIESKPLHATRSFGRTHATQIHTASSVQLAISDDGMTVFNSLRSTPLPHTISLASRPSLIQTLLYTQRAQLETTEI